VRHGRAPSVEELRAVAVKVIAHMEPAVVHTYLRTTYNARTRTIPILFDSIGHYNNIVHLFDIEHICDDDLFGLLDYPWALGWLETHGDDVELPQCVFGIKHAQTVTHEAMLVESQPAAPRCCCVCNEHMGIRVRKCSECRSFWYCSQRCQREHWTGTHRHVCAAYKALVESFVPEDGGHEEEEEEEEEESEEEEEEAHGARFVVYPRQMPGEPAREPYELNTPEAFQAFLMENVAAAPAGTQENVPAVAQTATRRELFPWLPDEE